MLGGGGAGAAEAAPPPPQRELGAPARRVGRAASPAGARRRGGLRSGQPPVPGRNRHLQLGPLRERLAERRLSLELTDAAKAALAEAGWDPAFGARPLKRAIQRLVENPLALRLLEGDFADGDTIRVDAQDGELVFERGGVAEPAAL